MNRGLCTLFQARNICRGLCSRQIRVSQPPILTATVCPAQPRKRTIPGLNQQSRTLTTVSPQSLMDSQLDEITYERVCIETLDALCDYIEELTDKSSHIKGIDVAYGDGVLTINLGTEYGTYVINRQTPNKQIWLSSPTSGPKRYDFVGPKTAETGKWIYKRTGESMHELLQREIGQILREQHVNFLLLPYSS